MVAADTVLVRSVHTFDAFGYRQQNACDESLAVMRLLEDGDLFAKTRPEDIGVSYYGRLIFHINQEPSDFQWWKRDGQLITYVPGFWS